ncbi:MAG TPA: HNH endonuclease [Pyrinomonadaceae bacterium]|jgi:5-methylcytosine-specific restriction endonuclease McrA
MASLNGRVLLLNYSYEPLGTVGVARAMCLVIRGAVTVEEYDGGRVLRSPSAEFRVPAVLRLRRYVNVRRRRQAAGMRRLRIFIRDCHRCQYCGQRRAAAELTLDHITPRSRGGRSTPENLATACVACNTRKGNRTPDEARMPLLTSQKPLGIGLEHLLLCHYAESRPAWRKYLYVEGVPLNRRREPA